MIENDGAETTMVASIKIDKARLRVIERIARRERGAAGTANDARNHVAVARSELRLDLQKHEVIRARTGVDDQTLGQIAGMKERLVELDEEFAAAEHEQTVANERSTAAGGLLMACERFLEDGGRQRP